MMAANNIASIVEQARVSLENKYNCSVRNTEELKQRAMDMLAFHNGDILINEVVGGGDSTFKANISIYRFEEW